MYRAVPKRRIRRIEDTPENEILRIKKYTLELCRETDDELWHELVNAHLEDLRVSEKIIKK